MGTDTLARRPAPIDPKIRARRIAVQRDAGRRRLARLTDLAVVAVVVAAFAVALRSPLLDVDAVEVRGAERTGVAAVLEAAGVAPGDQLIDVDVGAVGRRVGALPWAQEVTVSRHLGGEVRITVAERSPVARVRSEGRTWLVDREGAVLAEAAEVPDLAPTLPVLDVAAPALARGAALGEAAGPALRLAEALVDALPGAVHELGGGPDLTATLVGGGAARFGDAGQLDAKLLALRTILAEVDLDGLELIDLRVPGNPVLTREDP